MTEAPLGLYRDTCHGKSREQCAAAHAGKRPAIYSPLALSVPHLTVLARKEPPQLVPTASCLVGLVSAQIFAGTSTAGVASQSSVFIVAYGQQADFLHACAGMFLDSQLTGRRLIRVRKRATAPSYPCSGATCAGSSTCPPPEAMLPQ